MSPRPKSDTPKSEQYRIRMTAEDKKILEYCCEKTGLTKAEIIRKGINNIYMELQGLSNEIKK